MSLHFRTVAAATALSLGASQAMAATQFGDHFTLSGFGTLGVVQTDSDAAQFIRDGQPTGATKDLDYNVDSNVGAQLTATATKWLSGTVQLMAAHRTEENISMEVEWAFAKLAPVKGLEIRAGRLEMPVFAISDFRNVGYANTWIRPPDEVYGLAMLRRLEGGDATYHLPIGSNSLSLSVLVGKSFVDAPNVGVKTDVNDIRGANLQWESEWVTLRAGRIKGKVEILGGDNYTFTGFGAIVDRNNIIAQAEYVTRRSEKAPNIVDADGWYVLGGYRFNSLVPYMIYGHTKPKYDVAPAHISGDQTTIAAGVRWDAFKSAALKLQVERVDTNDTGGISFTPTFMPLSRPVTVASLALDFVF